MCLVRRLEERELLAHNGEKLRLDLENPIADCTFLQSIGEELTYAFLTDAYPEIVAHLEFRKGKVTKIVRLSSHSNQALRMRIWFINETDMWSSEFRENERSGVIEHIVCGPSVPIMCPALAQSTHTSEKNWYSESRTAQDVLSGLQENARMLNMLQTITGAKFVVMYGSLIGQWWNSQSLPWDTDMDVHILDVQTFESWLTQQERMPFPRGHANGVHHVRYYRLPEKNFTICHDTHPKNHIEFRLIHIPTGVYTDIMSISLTNDTKVIARNVQSRPAVLKLPVLAMKASFNNLWGGNIHNAEDILPLLPCALNGAILNCPNKIEIVLRQKYPHFDDLTWYRDTLKVNFSRTEGCWERIV